MHNERCHSWKDFMIETCVFPVSHWAASTALGKCGRGAPADSRGFDTHHQCRLPRQPGFVRTVRRLNGPPRTIVQSEYGLR